MLLYFLFLLKCRQRRNCRLAYGPTNCILYWNENYNVDSTVRFHSIWPGKSIQVDFTITIWDALSVAFSALTLLVGWQEGHQACKKLSGEVLAWLSVWSEVQTCIWPSWCHCHSLSLASVKSRLVLPFWYRPTRVVPENGPLNGCMYLRCINQWTGCTLAIAKAICITNNTTAILQLNMLLA